MLGSAELPAKIVLKERPGEPPDTDAQRQADPSSLVGGRYGIGTLGHGPAR